MTAPIISLGEFERKAWEVYSKEMVKESGDFVPHYKYSPSIHTYNALISRLLKKSDFVRPEKGDFQVYDVSNNLYKEKYGDEKWIDLDSYIPLFAGEWKHEPNKNPVLSRVRNKDGWTSYFNESIIKLQGHANFNLSHPIFSNELKDYKKISETIKDK